MTIAEILALLATAVANIGPEIAETEGVLTAVATIYAATKSALSSGDQAAVNAALSARGVQLTADMAKFDADAAKAEG